MRPGVITILVEPDWLAVQPEVALLIEAHWRELAVNRDVIPLDPDWEQYARIAKAGMMHFVSVRADGVMVGYHCSFVMPHIHYKGTLHAFVDVFYIKPEYRRGSVGVRLFRVVERTLKARGVKKIMTPTKNHLKIGHDRGGDVGDLLIALGHQWSERQFVKWIGD